jgi:hypothetical protein
VTAGSATSGFDDGQFLRIVEPVFPPSRSEQRAAQTLLEKAEPVKDELLAAGQDVASQLKDSARTALEEVKDTAADAKQAVADTPATTSKRPKRPHKPLPGQ